VLREESAVFIFINTTKPHAFLRVLEQVYFFTFSNNLSKFIFDGFLSFQNQSLVLMHKAQNVEITGSMTFLELLETPLKENE